jgi:hypothetical protein
MSAIAEAWAASSVTPFGEDNCDAGAHHPDATQGFLCCVLAEDHADEWHLDPVDGPWKTVLKRSEGSLA